MNNELQILQRREQRWHTLAENNRQQARNHYSQGNWNLGTWHADEADRCDHLANITRQQINQLTNSPTNQSNQILEHMLLGERIGMVQWDTHTNEWEPT